MNNNVIVALTNLHPDTLAGIDNVVAFNEADDRLYAIGKDDLLCKRFETIKPIKRAAELERLKPFKLLCTERFFLKHPDSLLQSYVDGEHIDEASESLTLYTAAYIHLYRLYRSLSTLTGESFIKLIDGFIGSCINEDTDHPATICYYNYDAYKILKLRKSVFTMFKSYLGDYAFYRELLRLQNSYGLEDAYFRQKKDLIITYINESCDDAAPAVQAA